MTRWLCPVALLALAAPVAAGAQEVVQGVVRESGSGHPVSGAQVSALPRGPIAWTDNDGRFRLSTASRPDSLRIIAIGYGATRLALMAGATVEVTLVPLTVVLPELISTAGRFEERAAEVTAPVVTIPKAEIEAQAAVATDQVVSQLPGVQSIPTQPAGTAISIRGIGDSRVLVLVDGEPVGGSLLQSTDLSRLSTVAVQRIEVTKGPMSSVYGSDALGGVINLVTQGPPQALQLGVSARTGSFGRLEGYGEAGGTFGKFGFSVTGGAREQQAVPGTFSSGADPLERIYDVRSSFRYAASKRVALRADVMYNYERQRWPLSGGFNGFTDISGVSGWTEATLDAGGGVWRARVFAEHFDYRYRSARGDLPIANSGTTQNESLVRGLLARSQRNGANSLDVGVQGSLRDVEAPDRILSDQASDEQVEVYAQDVLRLGRVLLNGGARYTWNSQWNGNLSPSLGVAWEPVNQVRVKASVARGFRGPSFKELAWDFGNAAAGYTILGNPDLVPESSWALDAAVAYAPWPTLSLEIAGFRNNIHNLIDFSEAGHTSDPIPLIIYTPTNIAVARTQGIEATARWASGTWVIAAGYTYLNARNLVDDLPLNRRATNSGRLRATKSWGVLRGLRGDVTALYTGAAPIIGESVAGSGTEISGEQGAFLQWNAGVQLGVFEALSLNAGVDNVFNQKPENWSGLIERRFWIGFSTQFKASGGEPQ